jgi:hypothetical protein
MTEDEIKAWLNVDDVGRPLRRSIVAGMADVPYPATAGAQFDAFRAFLSSWKPGQSFWEPHSPGPVHVKIITSFDTPGLTRVEHDGSPVWAGSVIGYLHSRYAPTGQPVILEVESK